MSTEVHDVTRREPEAMGLSSAERSLLCGLVSGQHLRADRTLDGGKAFRLHAAPTGQPVEVPADVVQRLCTAGLVASNLKFPRASYLLTAAGMRIAAQLTAAPLRPLVARPS